MKELLRVLGRFAIRDCIYMTGGLLILLCFLYSTGHFSSLQEVLDWVRKLSPYAVIYFSIAYFVLTWMLGYVSQIILERMCIVKLEVEEINEKQLILAYEISKDITIDRIQRTTNLKQAGVTLGSSFAISSYILLITLFNRPNLYVFSLAMLFAGMSILLILEAHKKLKKEIASKQSMISALLK